MRTMRMSRCLWMVTMLAAAGCSQTGSSGGGAGQGDPGVTVGDVKTADAFRLANETAFDPPPIEDRS